VKHIFRERERERERVLLGMRRKWERTREIETMRLPSFHDGDGDSSHFTFNGLLYLLTCTGLTTDDDDDAIIHTILLSLLLHV